MPCRRLHVSCTFGLLVALLSGAGAAAQAAPRIDNVSLRGVQAGGITALSIDGRELSPETKIWFTAPSASYSIKDGATDKHLEVEFKLDGATPAGIYLLRVASASGISPAVALAVDNLPQIPFSAEMATTNVAMTGAVTGTTVLTTSFTGSKGQRVVVDVEGRRLGSKLNPVLRLYDARHVQLAWSRGLVSLAGDPRLATTLPADGKYSIEVHDALFRGASPGFFRLKVGDLQYADLVYPLGAQQGKETSFEFPGGNLPAAARAAATWSIVDGRRQIFEPAKWPADVGLLSGSRPAVIVSNHAETLEQPPSEGLQQIMAAPVAINGRIGAGGETDRYRLEVSPGQKLRFDVLAHRAGSPLDGVLTIENETGKQLATNDDRKETSDPGLDFTVPKDVHAVVVAIRDLEKRGGEDYVYRISVMPAGQPNFTLSLEDDRILVPKDGAALARVRVERSGYNGPIKLAFSNLPQSVSVTGDEIPAGASQALVTVSAPGLSPAQSLTTVLGSSTVPKVSVTRAALPPETVTTEHLPWLGDEVAVAVTNPSPLSLAWDLYSAETNMALGVGLPVQLHVNRAEGAAGAVRLTLLTTQVPQRKKVKVNNREQEVDDVERMIRFEKAPTIPADGSDAAAKILIPADLPRIAYDLAIQADLLAADGKRVLASAVTPARRMLPAPAMSVELASADAVEARAGLGETGKVTGKLHRAAGFTLPAKITLTGLPKGNRPPVVDLPGDKSDFEFPVKLRFGTPEGDLKGVKLVATALPDPKKPKTKLTSDEVPLGIKVVGGDKPPPEQPRSIFEDQVEFLAALTEGGGQASLIADQKYSGLASIKVTPDQRYNPALPGLGVKIREFPGPGEYRYLRYAWKKQGGQAICLQLNHDGKWGPEGDGKPKFRYHAGPAGECYGGSVGVDENLPAEFTVVTRDLFADFGEFTLAGIALSAVDGEYALFDHIYLGTQVEDFDLVKP